MIAIAVHNPSEPVRAAGKGPGVTAAAPHPVFSNLLLTAQARANPKDSVEGAAAGKEPQTQFADQTRLVQSLNAVEPESSQVMSLDFQPLAVAPNPFVTGTVSLAQPQSGATAKNTSAGAGEEKKSKALPSVSNTPAALQAPVTAEFAAPVVPPIFGQASAAGRSLMLALPADISPAGRFAGASSQVTAATEAKGQPGSCWGQMPALGAAAGEQPRLNSEDSPGHVVAQESSGQNLEAAVQSNTENDSARAKTGTPVQNGVSSAPSGSAAGASNAVHEPAAIAGQPAAAQGAITGAVLSAPAHDAAASPANTTANLSQGLSAPPSAQASPHEMAVGQPRPDVPGLSTPANATQRNADPHAILDSAGTAREAVWQLTPTRVEAGFANAQNSWISIVAQRQEGHLTAVLESGSTAARGALESMLPQLASHLAERQLAVDQIGVSLRQQFPSGGEMGDQHQGQGEGGTPQPEPGLWQRPASSSLAEVEPSNPVIVNGSRISLRA